MWLYFKWIFGKCPGCGEWNTLIEVDESPKSSKLLENKENARPLGEVKVRDSERVQTEIEEFNRVMGGGIVRDSISIITAKTGCR